MPGAGAPYRSALLRRAWLAKQVLVPRLRHVRGFRFEGRRHPFLFHPYNRTWRNERQVEVPLARRWLRAADPHKTLEVGNVLGHYGVSGHTVVDRYEQAPGVRNEDFLRHVPEVAPEWIVSVSTFEHIRWDEPARDPAGFDAAVRHAQDILAPGGRLFLTLPLGYNPRVDAFLASPPQGFQVGFLARWGPAPGQWHQVPSVPASHPYDPSGAATAVAVVRWQRDRNL